MMITTQVDDTINIDFASNGIAKHLSFEEENPFTHPVFGKFLSFEGFWYYVRSHGTDTTARFISGGWGRRHCKPIAVPVTNFDEILYEGYYHMLMAMPEEKLKPILENKKRFTFQYIDVATKKVRSKSFAWMSNGITNVIDHVREGKVYPAPDYSRLLASAIVD